MLDAKSMKVLATIANGDGVDALGWDGAEKLIYIPGGRPDNVTIVRQDAPDKYTVVATVATMPGAKTIAVDPVKHLAHLFQPEYGPAPAPVPAGSLTSSPHPASPSSALVEWVAWRRPTSVTVTVPTIAESGWLIGSPRDLQPRARGDGSRRGNGAEQ